MITLRDYQRPVRDAVLESWTRVRSVLAVMATGAGKTVVFASIVSNHKGASAVVVHRKEIVVQISLALAAFGVRHRVVAPPATIRLARKAHLDKFDTSFLDPDALCGVASVQTLTSPSAGKNGQLQRWVNQVTLCVYDEGHHYVATGLWSRAVECMPNAKLLKVTACPERADGKGLGIMADGFAEEMVEGPQVQWLIERGYLSPFRYYAPTTDLDLEGLTVTASGDFNAKAFRERVVESHLVGDVVEQYSQFAEGKRAIVFATDVATSNEIANRFNTAGGAAVALDGSTDGGVRAKASAQFATGSVLQLVNVDLFDEGYDVPAAEVAVLARPTQSLNKFLQMCGRVLRPVYAPGHDLGTVEGRLEAIAKGPKPFAVIIDPVRNWERHGMPDWPRVWSLQGREKGTRGVSDTIPQRVCVTCSQLYEAYYEACPHCGAKPLPPERSLPKHVDGDLAELDVAAMAALFEKMRRADCSDEEHTRGQIARGMPDIGRRADLKRHRHAVRRRETLRNLMGWWVGAQHGRSLSEVQRRFYLRYNVDMASAMTLNAKDTDALTERLAAGFSLDAKWPGGTE